MNDFGYVVFDATSGGFLQDDEASFGSFNSATIFTGAALAQDIADREHGKNGDLVLYVMHVH